MIKQLSATAVLVSSGLNVSEFQQIWLLEKGILLRDEFGPDAVFTPVALTVQNKNFDLIIFPQRLQVAIKQEFNAAQPLLNRIIGTFFENVPSASFPAIGFNFEFEYQALDAAHAQGLSRRLCIRDDNPLADEFSGDQSRFGLILQKDIFESRMTLEVRSDAKAPDGVEILTCRLNFHRSLETAGALRPFINSWYDALVYASALIERLDRVPSRNRDYV